MKRFIKNLSLILVLIFVSISFCACGSLRSQIVFNADGTIDEAVYIELKTEDVLEAGYNINNVRLWIYQEANKQVDEIVNSFEDSLDDAIIDAEQTKKEELQSYKNGITKIIQNWQNDTLIIGIRFASVDVYKYYYNIVDDGSVADEVKEGFFYNEYYFKSGTEFTRHRVIYDTISYKFNEKYPGLINEDDKMYYTYVTTSKRVHSNADSISSMAGYYYHTWEITDENIDRGVVLYYKVANPQNWILLALGCTGILLIALIIIAIIITKNNKKDHIIKEIKMNKNLLIKLLDKIKTKK